MARRQKAKAPPPALIELRDVTKVYGRGEGQVRALDGISLRIDEGEFAAIMGFDLSTIPNINHKNTPAVINENIPREISPVLFEL